MAKAPSLRSLCLGLAFILFLVVAFNPLRHGTAVLFAKTDVAVPCEVLTEGMRGSEYPKIVHQMWNTKELPPVWQANLEKCQALNPDHQFLLWTHQEFSDYIKTQHSWFWPTFQSYRHDIQRIDAVRYFMLSDFGGIYADVDIECLVPFDDIIAKWSTPNETHALLLETNPIGFTNSFMATKQGHPFFKAAMKGLPAYNRNYWSAHWTIMRSAGPCFLHQMYREFPCKGMIGSIPVSEGHRMWHHAQAATWHSWDGKLVKFLDVHQRFFIALGLAAVVLFLLALRSAVSSWVMWVVSELRTMWNSWGQKTVTSPGSV